MSKQVESTSRKTGMDSAANPLFIVSSGRSGTTLLRGILNASGELYIPYESDFFARAYPFYAEKEELTELDYQRLVRFFLLTSQKKGWGMTESYLLTQLKQHQPRTFSELNHTIYQAYLQKKSLSHLKWGIKHPVLIASIDKIFNAFPTAQVVHIVRDGRDVCLSYQKIHQQHSQKFGPKGSLAAALYWIDGLRRVQENRSSQLYEVRYEDILLDSARAIENLCLFLGIEFTEDLHQGYQDSHRNEDLLLSQESSSIHSKVKNGIDPENKNKFLTQMSLLQRFIFEAIAYPYLEKYGYYLEFPFLGNRFLHPIRFCLYRLARLFNNCRYHMRDISFFKRSLNPR